jgi:enoyl-CoA hydratase/carnithine racemase
LKVKSVVKTLGEFRVFEISIDSPQTRNAIGVTLATNLESVLSTGHATQFDRCDVVILKAASTGNPPIWIAGGDLKELNTLDADGAASYARSMHRVGQLIQESSPLFIHFIDGRAIGGGAELAVMGDLRIATPQGSLDWKQLHMGLSTGYGGARRLKELVGLAAAQKILYFSENLTCDQAMDYNLFHACVQSELEFYDLVARLCNRGVEALKAQKFMLQVPVHCALRQETDELEIKKFASIWKNKNHIKALEQFLKRP